MLKESVPKTHVLTLLPHSRDPFNSKSCAKKESKEFWSCVRSVMGNGDVTHHVFVRGILESSKAANGTLKKKNPLRTP